MKVLLIRPPQMCYKGSSLPAVDLPLGLMYIAAALEKKGIDTDIFDSMIYQDAKSSRKNTKYELVTSDNIMFGASFETIKKFVSRYKPDMVGISNMFTAQFSAALETARAVKEADKNIVVVMGGAHPSIAYSEIIKNHAEIDAIVIGEGEHALADMAELLKNKKSFSHLPGVASMVSGQLVANKHNTIDNIDELLFPAYHKLDMERYFKLNETSDSRPRYKYEGSQRAVTMVTSRGCPFECTFCSVHLHMGRKWRSHSPEYIINHIKHLLDKYDIRHIHFEDDNFMLDTNRFRQIADRMQTDGIRITWDTPNGVRVDSLKGDMIEDVVNSGCTYLVIGIESGAEHVRNNLIKKNISPESIVEAAALCKKNKIDLEAFFIIGMPGEKIEDMRKTINFAVGLEKKYDVRPMLFKVTPLIGTEVYRICKDRNYFVKDQNSENYSKATSGESMIKTEDFSPDDIDRLRGDFFKKHKASYYTGFAAFLIKHPGYLINLFMMCLVGKLSPGGRIRNAMRYKNCVLRGVGLDT